MTGTVDLVIPTWNCERWIDGCLEAVFSQTLAPRRVLVIDDGSEDETVALLDRWRPRIERTAFDRRGGFARTVSAGIGLSTAPMVALLNADTEPEPSWLEELVNALEGAGSGFGSAASLMLAWDEDERVDDAGDVFSVYGSASKRGHDEPVGDWSDPGTVLSPSAGAALYRRELLERTGGFDPGYDSYLEDVDLGLRAQLLGFDCLYVPAARVRHYGGGSQFPRASYVRRVTANRIATVLKSFPGSVLLRALPRLVWGQVYYALAYRHPVQSLLGFADAAARLPGILRQRRDLQRRRRRTPAEFGALLETRFGEPPLRRLVGDRLRKR